MERTCLCQIHRCGGAEDCVGLIEQAHQACYATHRKRLWLDTAQTCAVRERILVVDDVALLIDGESIVNASDILHITAIFFAIGGAYVQRALQIAQSKGSDHTVCRHFCRGSGVVVETCRQ